MFVLAVVLAWLRRNCISQTSRMQPVSLVEIFRLWTGSHARKKVGNICRTGSLAADVSESVMHGPTAPATTLRFSQPARMGHSFSQRPPISNALRCGCRGGGALAPISGRGSTKPSPKPILHPDWSGRGISIGCDQLPASLQGTPPAETDFKKLRALLARRSPPHQCFDRISA